jgi:preprotein translocase subunit SecD
MNQRWFIWLILLITAAAVFFVFTPEINFTLGSLNIKRDLQPKFGLDLQGGTHLVLKADMVGIEGQDRDRALESTKSIIGRRVDLYGVAEPVIQTSKVGDDFRIIVELPGIEEINQAIDLIGKTAQLDFREEKEGSPSGNLFEDFKKTDLTGRELSRSEVVFDPNTGNPQVSLEFNEEGKNKFAEITKNNVGRSVAIFLDELPITIPTVNEPISDGRAVISGDFTVDQAKNLAIQLNAGALPVPIEVVEQRNIGATLGQASVKKSGQAGVLGLLTVILFMIAYYGKLGFLADVALMIYGLITFALYKLIPVTLTLPGLAGFFLSIGMAVDSNILIFERMKEEVRGGEPLRRAMELGFGRAWDSIKDANVCTLITCFILFNPFNWSFLNTSGTVKGFALTLGLGVIISLFTGVVVTRTLMRRFLR